jgi:phosphopantetheinyl transferase
MPLIYHTSEANILQFGVWHNTEGDDFFLNGLPLYDAEYQQITSLASRKKREWLCSRYLLYQLVPSHDLRGACLKDGFGKPFIEGSDLHISISHTSEYTAAIVSQHICGIDIQVIVNKIVAIGSRFIAMEEFSYVPPDNKIIYYHVIWGAKEAMYKCYGRKELDFRKHMTVHAFEFDKEGFIFKGEIHTNDFRCEYNLYCRQLQNMMLVYAYEAVNGRK